MMRRAVCLFAFACMLPAQEREALDALAKAEKWIDSDPAASLATAESAAAADWSRRKWFWPVMLRAQVKLGKWDAADSLGTEAVKEIEAGRLFEHADEIGGEVRFRFLFADALEHRGRVAEARAQRSRAEERAKAALLATLGSTAAKLLRVKDLDGNVVSLHDRKGKVVIALFWATWCAPCMRELDAIKGVYPRLRDRAEVLAINVDDMPEVVKNFAKSHELGFSVFTAKGSEVFSYTNGATLEDSNIPQLYVIDREGDIRFHVTGFDDDGLFALRVGWMIEAALR